MRSVLVVLLLVPGFFGCTLTRSLSDLSEGNGGAAGETACTVPDDWSLGPAPPFTVDDHFSPTGFDGDAKTGAVSLVPSNADNDATCDGLRPRIGRVPMGVCHQFTYTFAADAPSFAAVYWQYPNNNWGSEPGLAIAPGAQRVSFYAKGARGGERVRFVVGEPVPEQAAYNDLSVHTEAETTLRNEWRHLVIDLGCRPYDRVLSGFGWSIAAEQNQSPITFYVDDIRWE